MKIVSHLKIVSYLKIVSHNHTGDICPKQSSAARIDCVRLHGVSSPLGQLMSAATHICDFTSLQCNANTQIHKYTNTNTNAQLMSTGPESNPLSQLIPTTCTVLLKIFCSCQYILFVKTATSTIRNFCILVFCFVDSHLLHRCVLLC